jgi:arabinose-5-phosphate isomerase
MHGMEDLPGLTPETPFEQALEIMISSNLGAILILEADGKLVGLLTDGDIKRIFKQAEHDHDIPVRDVMTRKPRVVEADRLAEEALRLMEEGTRQITVLLVVDQAGHAEGLIRLHDILRAKIG